jgi:anti-sigma regulatory factor (Ser/Thr protein kinase)
MEHSCGQEKSMLIRFYTGKSEIRMEVESPGKPFTLAALKNSEAGEKLKSGSRRGWGLKLVTGIMDDLRVERINDRTRVIITKNINQSEVST